MDQDAVHFQAWVDAVKDLAVLLQAFGDLVLVCVAMDHLHPPGFLILLNVLQSSIDLVHAGTFGEVHNPLVLQVLQFLMRPPLGLRLVHEPLDHEADHLGVAEQAKEGREDRDPCKSQHDHRGGDAVVDVEVGQHLRVEQQDCSEGAADQQQTAYEERWMGVDLPGQGGAIDLQPQAAKGKEPHDQQEGDGVDGSKQSNVTVQHDAHGRANCKEHEDGVMRSVPPGVCLAEELRQAPVSCHALKETNDPHVAGEHRPCQDQQRVDGHHIPKQRPGHSFCQVGQSKGRLLTSEVPER
mmetsp:Transcript_49802/g.118688  ORF Transcript_49802/g.118688 Transcript_49802/m.118688 type:complete len:296 (+) Transcript_49802:381-1268(+)